MGNSAQIPYKFLTAIVVILTMIIGVYVTAGLKDSDLGSMNLVLSLVNSLLLLIILGILFYVKEHDKGKIKNQKRAGKYGI
ncbi:hypothetical protein HYV80_07455 [Candidatus Woesearchaeota archaeon]|nr:hypothetical protein [Candidatus Woesearchaeota archaeon]